MKSVRTEIDIDAPKAQVWKVLCALDEWPSWNDVIRTMVAKPQLGGKVAFRIHIDGLPPLPFTARISEWEPEKALAWRGGPSGVFTGNHYFRLEPRGDDRTQLIHGEDFGGVLATLVMRKAILHRLETTYDRLNRSIKKQVEFAY